MKVRAYNLVVIVSIILGSHSGLNCAALEEMKEMENEDAHVTVPAHEYARTGNIDALRRCTDAQLRETDENGTNALHCASGREIAQYLVERGLDPHALDVSGWSSLHWAACNGELEMLQYFVEELEMEPRTPIEDSGSNTLHLAAQGGCIEIVEYLVNEQNMPITTTDCHGRKALDIAREHEHPAVVEFLATKLFGVE